MKLYHGTSESAAKRALVEGLVPRVDSGVGTNWEDHPSSDAYVYLTVAYAGYFAMSASAEGERWAVIEIDTDLLPDSVFVPDEDFMEQITRDQDLSSLFEMLGDESEAWKGDMRERTAWFRENIELWPDLWVDSISGLGNCAHAGVIPPESITKVAFINPSVSGLAMMAMDPMISLMNYAICSNKYKALTRWFMGYPVCPQDFRYGQALNYESRVEGLEDLDPSDPLVRHIQIFREQDAAMQSALDDRSGVEVLDV